MKKRIMILPISALMLFVFNTCGNSETPKTESDETTVTADTTTEEVIIEEEVFTQEMNDAANVMLGTWKGKMSGKDLTVVIEKTDGNEIFGYNTLGDTRRDLTGTFVKGDWDQSCSAAFEATLNEPGDDEWDGVFTIKFIGYFEEVETADGDLDCGENMSGFEASGTWKPNNGKASKDFTLTKKL